MLKKSRVTNRDVARHAGVSTAVVSYVINNGPRPTSPEVRERVLQAIQELDYHPNAVARGLRHQRTHTIGFIANDYFPLDVFVSPYSAGILTGLIDQLKGAHHYLMVYPVAIGEDLTSLELLLRSGRLDGVVVRLVQDPPATDALLNTIAATNVPCVCIERAVAPHPFPSVTIDDRHGVYSAVEYLVAQGHQRIAHIHGDLRYLSARVRLETYKQALREHGVAVDDDLIGGGTWDPHDAATVTQRLLQLPDPPTAIFAASDDLALRVIATLREHGKRVPGDVAVVGFDDVPIAGESVPALTTVRIPLSDMGRRAAALVLQQIEQGEQVPSSVVVPTELVRRQTA